ncbi:serine/threonine-protein kinase [Actinomadura miaoliensis]|uniref:Serine/threonine-protein kinase n=1 Tax=Actinomadura miaoliensis TaxID=430685 RepID=A0ABP7VTI6_9ACTN
MEPLQPGDPRRVAGYRIEGRLGAGGMGQVFLGRSPGGRQVAVKLVRPEHADDPGFRARFAREVQAARLVGGFHTAPVVDADPDADPPWMVTAFIPGPSLRDAVADHGPLAPEEATALCAGLAEGLAAIHAHGLVHRDLKPGNVILAADGPRIIDFGIARVLDASAITVTGAVVGTYAYMSPEQMRGETIGPASDVFSLGALLCFALTGRPPFGTGPLPALVHRITGERPDLHGVPDPPRRLVEACLAKDPADRPPVGDILAVLSESATLSESTTLSESAAPSESAEPTTAVSPATAPPRTPVQEQDSTAPKTTSTRTTASLSFVAFAPDGQTLVVVGHGDGQGILWLWDLASRTTRGVFALPTRYLGHQALSPDGRILATTAGDGKIWLWDLARHTCVGSLTAPTDSMRRMAFSPDGTALAAEGGGRGNKSGGLWLWRLPPPAGDNARVVRAKHIASGGVGSFASVAFSPDGRTLAGGGLEDDIQLWDVGTGFRTARFTGPLWRRTAALFRLRLIMSLAFSPDGGTLACGGHYPGVRLWDVKSHSRIGTLSGPTDSLWSVAFSPDGKILAAAGVGGPQDETLWLWDVAGRTRIAAINTPGSTGIAVAFSPDGGTLASIHLLDETVRLWEVPSGTSLGALACRAPDSFSASFRF